MLVLTTSLSAVGTINEMNKENINQKIVDKPLSFGSSFQEFDDDWNACDGDTPTCEGDIYHRGDVTIGNSMSPKQDTAWADACLSINSYVLEADHKISALEFIGIPETNEVSKIADIRFIGIHGEMPFQVKETYAEIEASRGDNGKGRLELCTLDPFGSPMSQNRLILKQEDGITIQSTDEICLVGSLKLRGRTSGGDYSIIENMATDADPDREVLSLKATGDGNTGATLNLYGNNDRKTHLQGDIVFNTDGQKSMTIDRDGSLKLHRGSDIAEPFKITDKDKIEPGMIVVIDSENPGNLKISEKPYDKCVAGIVSGAGGIKPGITLNQEDIFDGTINIALAGRVYALCDTTFGSIEPGDLLTTSSSPGYAMRVTDFEKSQGAIIGKAMTSLDDGIGLVLILVSLQ